MNVIDTETAVSDQIESILKGNKRSIPAISAALYRLGDVRRLTSILQEILREYDITYMVDTKLHRECLAILSSQSVPRYPIVSIQSDSFIARIPAMATAKFDQECPETNAI